MIIQTQYNYEKKWTDTKEDDLIKIIKEEVGDIEPQGTLSYIKGECKKSRTIIVGSCKFRQKP